MKDNRKYLYNVIKIRLETSYGSKIKYYIFDPKEGKVIVNNISGEEGWMPLDIILMTSPLYAGSGLPLDLNKYFEKLTAEELKEINEKTLDL